MATKKLWKYTTTKGLTRPNHPGNGRMRWEVGKNYTLRAVAQPELCSRHVFHAYEHPLAAMLFREHHIDTRKYRWTLWEARGEVVVRDGFRKCGCFSLKLVRKAKSISLSRITPDQMMELAVRLLIETPEFKGDKRARAVMLRFLKTGMIDNEKIRNASIPHSTDYLYVAEAASQKKKAPRKREAERAVRFILRYGRPSYVKVLNEFARKWGIL